MIWEAYGQAVGQGRGGRCHKKQDPSYRSRLERVQRGLSGWSGCVRAWAVRARPLLMLCHRACGGDWRSEGRVLWNAALYGGRLRGVGAFGSKCSLAVRLWVPQVDDTCCMQLPMLT